jgi:Mn2+/Fe2+ NRAMP family transporter
MKTYTLKDLKKQFGISERKAGYLIRNNVIKPIIDGGKILVSDEELGKYLSLPKDVRKKQHTNYLKTLGPGLITGASDDDPSGILTYSTVGAAFGLGLSWLALYLLPMMTAVQETVARIGIVTGKGLSGAIGKHYGRLVLYPIVTLLLIANTINIGADISAMAASIQLLLPVNYYLAAIVITLFMLFLVINFSYHKYSKILKWLTLSLLAYIVTGFIINPDWILVAKSLVTPRINFNYEEIAAIVAVMGTTISPYLFFWQASEEVEEKRDNGTISDHHVAAIKEEISEMRKDTYAGMSLANLVFLFIVITTATVLHTNGITTISSTAEAATALRPLAGDFAYLLFTIGIFGVGLLAVPVLAGSSAYGMSELFKWHEGLNKRYNQAKGFYDIIIISMLVGLGMNFVGINPVKALYFAAIVNGIVAPVLMYFIFKIGSDKKIMGEFRSPAWIKITGWFATYAMAFGAALLIYFFVRGL